MAYRVLRLLEYTYDSVEVAHDDMEAWSTPTEGSIKFGPHKRIRSTIIQYPFKEEVSEELR